jgi:hypothetical protein
VIDGREVVKAARRTYVKLLEPVEFHGKAVGRPLLRLAPAGTLVRVEINDDNEVVDKRPDGTIRISLEWQGHKLYTRVGPGTISSLA